LWLNGLFCAQKKVEYELPYSTGAVESRSGVYRASVDEQRRVVQEFTDQKFTESDRKQRREGQEFSESRQKQRRVGQKFP